MDKSMNPLSRRLAGFLRLAMFAGAVMFATRAMGDAPAVSISGEGWGQYGRIQKSSDTLSGNYNGNFIHAAGAHVLLRSQFTEKLEANLGLGMVERHYLGGGLTNRRGRTAVVVTPYVVQANFGYSFWNSEASKLKFSAGFLDYSYNPDVKNLGLYLLRGPVYPGLVLSGFETKNTLPWADFLGMQLHHETGSFQQDLLITSETEVYPVYDFSPAYLAHYQFGKGFRIGGGVNLYHYIPIEKKMTSPTTPAPTGEPDDTAVPVTDPSQRVWIYVDTTAGHRDTTNLSFRGTKVMLNVSFDPKEAFSFGESLSPDDLKIYSEVAIIGLDNSKAYKAIYGDYAHRMPIMVGFNFPTFQKLDHVSLEVEVYHAQFKDDLQRYQPSSAYFASPLPVRNLGNLNLKRDDVKWALHAAKTISRVRISAQVANDHSRPGGKLLDIPAEWESLYTTPMDWYWMTKLSFFF